MSSKYPPFERVTAGSLAKGDQLLIRDRQADQPYGTWEEGPMASGVWTVVDDVSYSFSYRGRRAARTYKLLLEHPGAGQRTVRPSPSERFNRVL